MLVLHMMAEHISTDSLSSDSEFPNENVEDLSYCWLRTIPESIMWRTALCSLRLNNNDIGHLPKSIQIFSKLVSLDLSSNKMHTLCDELCLLDNLRTLICKNNLLNLKSLPKDMGLMKGLENVNFSGNIFKCFPPQFTELTGLRCLFFASNMIRNLPPDISRLYQLEVLYLGGNQLEEIPAEVGDLCRLRALNLAGNKLQSLPISLSQLHSLQLLNLHDNALQTLPLEIVSLNLVELSLRSNPLVSRFVQDFIYNPPSLLELAGRVIKMEKIHYFQNDMPQYLNSYMASAQRCVNPKCKGVYFSSRTEHVKFVDFCGKYRLPLLHYLCSPNCSVSQPSVAGSSSDNDTEDEDNVRMRIKRVLLG